jgi:cardiolipin synthase (CMP-forming)
MGAENRPYVTHLGFPGRECQTLARPATYIRRHGERQKPSDVTIPNLITIARLFLVPLTVWLIVSDEAALAFWVFVLAGVSDGVDGFIARQFNQRSYLGGFLDPLADKVLLVSIYVTFSIVGKLPVWLAILVVSRDLLIVGGVLLSWMLDKPMAMRPRVISKVNTVAQIVLASVVLADQAFTPDFSSVTDVLVGVVGLFTLGSAAVYVVD